MHVLIEVEGVKVEITVTPERYKELVKRGSVIPPEVFAVLAHAINNMTKEESPDGN